MTKSVDKMPPYRWITNFVIIFPFNFKRLRGVEHDFKLILLF